MLDPQSADTTLPPSVPPPRLEVNPNPVRATGSVVAFTLASPATVHLTVHDLRGARIKTLASGSAGAGRREIGWGAVDDRGSRLAAGVYFVRLEAGGRVVTRRFVLLP